MCQDNEGVSGISNADKERGEAVSTSLLPILLNFYLLVWKYIFFIAYTFHNYQQMCLNKNGLFQPT